MDIISLLRFEEGYSETPYYCSEGYPTAGTGIKLGPKGAPLSNYQFKISKAVDAVWSAEIVQQKLTEMKDSKAILSALNSCNDARQAVLISMAYQMGSDGLAKFVNTLRAIAEKRWTDAKAGMLNSAWAKQTPNRAKRHAQQMFTGEWSPEYK